MHNVKQFKFINLFIYIIFYICINIKFYFIYIQGLNNKKINNKFLIINFSNNKKIIFYFQKKKKKKKIKKKKKKKKKVVQNIYPYLIQILFFFIPIVYILINSYIILTL